MAVALATLLLHASTFVLASDDWKSIYLKVISDQVAYLKENETSGYSAYKGMNHEVQAVELADINFDKTPELFIYGDPDGAASTVAAYTIIGGSAELFSLNWGNPHSAAEVAIPHPADIYSEFLNLHQNPEDGSLVYVSTSFNSNGSIVESDKILFGPATDLSRNIGSYYQTITNGRLFHWYEDSNTGEFKYEIAGEALTKTEYLAKYEEFKSAYKKSAYEVASLQSLYGPLYRLSSRERYETLDDSSLVLDFLNSYIPEPSNPSAAPTSAAAPTPRPAGAASYEAGVQWKSIYEKRINDTINDIRAYDLLENSYFQGIHIEITALELADVNFDGTPELFIYGDIGGASGTVAAYTIIEKKAKLFYLDSGNPHPKVEDLNYLSSISHPYDIYSEFLNLYQNVNDGSFTYISTSYNTSPAHVESDKILFRKDLDLSKMIDSYYRPNEILGSDDRVFNWYENSETGLSRYEYNGEDIPRSEYVQKYAGFKAQYEKSSYKVASLRGDALPLYSKASGTTFAQGAVREFMDSYEAEPGVRIRIFLNGNEVAFDQAPINDNGRIFVPIRGISESFGATVNWDSQAKTVEVEKGGAIVEMTVGVNEMTIGGRYIPLDAPPQLTEAGRLLVPVRAVAESFAASVEWNAEQRAVYINVNLG
ncbi:MAG: hypothetical protein LBU32_12090 [Clostridiales bacterium]|nr:hypothetical protein [Clostridiales bacterium]